MQATYPFQKVHVDTKTLKIKDQVTSQLPKDHNIATLFPMKEGSTQATKKDHNIANLDPMKEDFTQLPKKEKKIKTPKIKNLAWIAMMSKVLTKLEKKHSIPVENRKPAMFTRRPKINHIIPKEFSSIFHLLAAPEPEPVTVPAWSLTGPWLLHDEEERLRLQPVLHLHQWQPL